MRSRSGMSGDEEFWRDSGARRKRRWATRCDACAHLEVEGAVDAVLLGAEDGGEVLGHGAVVSSLVRFLVAIHP